MLDSKQLLRQLTETPGGSGDEGRVVAAAIAAVTSYADEIQTDAIGNVILIKRGAGDGRRPRIMLAAHTDEISFMVRLIEKGGFLRVSQVGGFDARTLPGQEAVVHGKQDLLGIFGSKPPHLTSLDERKKSIPLQDLFIDVGLTEERVKMLVAVGDRITIRRQCMDLLCERMSGKAMDNRASVTAMAICLEELGKLRAQADTYAVGTVQEEIGCKGAQTAAFALMPDIAVAIDVCHGETPGVPDDLVQKIGAGPVLTFGPHIHPQLFAKLQEVASSTRIPVQVEVSQGATWTDADPIQISQAGVPTALISIPLRYMHTSVETLAFNDVRHAGILLAHFIASIDYAFVEGLSCYLKS